MPSPKPAINVPIAASESPATLDLVAETGLPLVDPAQTAQLSFYLGWHNEHLTLYDQSTAQKISISIDFTSGQYRHRRQHGGSYGQPLARAVLAKAGHCPHICDATGGLGQDAFVFASLGSQVTLLESSSVVYLLLKDALHRGAQDPQIAEIVKRISLHQLNSTTLPEYWPGTTRPSVVYLDPMYPESGKSAAAKKGIQVLQRILAFDAQDFLLLRAAIATATSRVVVKRPRRARPLAGATPSGNISSPNTRYDIYAGNG